MGPHSLDLRERVAAAVDAGQSQRQVAQRFHVSLSFVIRLLKRRRDAGDLTPRPHAGGRSPALDLHQRVRLAQLVADEPDATLEQLKQRGGFTCSLTTIWRTLRQMKLTYKKKTLHASERDAPRARGKRKRFRAKARRIDAKRLVFLDETGVTTTMTPRHARARRGERAVGSVPTSWKSMTVIAAVSLDGVKAPRVLSGATNTANFQAYVDEVLVPTLEPGDVVVFDNLKPHLAPGVRKSIRDVGAKVLRLPPYSSDYNPIEELWSKFKGKLREIGARTKEALHQAVNAALSQITPQDILGWFGHSGVYAVQS